VENIDDNFGIHEVQQNDAEITEEDLLENFYATPVEHIPKGAKKDLSNWKITPEHFHKVEKKLDYIYKEKTQNVEIIPDFNTTFFITNQDSSMPEINESLTLESFNVKKRKHTQDPKKSRCNRLLFKKSMMIPNESENNTIHNSTLNNFNSFSNELNLINNFNLFSKELNFIPSMHNQVIQLETEEIKLILLEKEIQKDYEDLYYGEDISEIKFEKLKNNLLKLSNQTSVVALKKEVDKKYEHLIQNAPKKQSKEKREMKDKVNKVFFDEIIKEWEHEKDE
jgi:hypothetical protein